MRVLRLESCIILMWASRLCIGLNGSQCLRFNTASDRLNVEANAVAAVILSVQQLCDPYNASLDSVSAAVQQIGAQNQLVCQLLVDRNGDCESNNLCSCNPSEKSFSISRNISDRQKEVWIISGTLRGLEPTDSVTSIIEIFVNGPTSKWTPSQDSSATSTSAQSTVTFGGATSATGATWATGATGATWATGATGATWATGAPGATWATGTTAGGSSNLGFIITACTSGAMFLVVIVVICVLYKRVTARIRREGIPDIFSAEHRYKIPPRSVLGPILEYSLPVYPDDPEVSWEGHIYQDISKFTGDQEAPIPGLQSTLLYTPMCSCNSPISERGDPEMDWTTEEVNDSSSKETNSSEEDTGGCAASDTGSSTGSVVEVRVKDHLMIWPVYNFQRNTM